ncbi:MAG: trigger factor [Vampirovibrionales bacterium]|nr:trigger factor [Vampirovibrionales bacterium]
MKVDVEKNTSGAAVITLELPADLASQEYHKACRRLSQRLNVPGFRRGKVPRNIVEKTIGVERIKQEALDRVLPNLLAGAISENRLEPISSPAVESYTFDLEQGITVKALVELRPEVKLPALDFEVTAEKFVAPEDTLDSALKEILERLTTLEPVIDRPTQADDIVSIDFAGTVDGAPIKGGATKNYRLDLKDNHFIDGFAEQVVGHTLGEEFTIEVPFPEDYHDTTLAGKQASFKIKINEINRRITPELNDETAKKLGDFSGKDALIESLKAGIEAQTEQKNRQQAELALVEKLVSLSEVDVPDSMAQRETKLLMDSMRQQMSRQGGAWEAYIEAQGGQESAWAACRVEAEKRLKTTLVFGTLAKELELRVADNEFFEAVQELAAMRRVDEKTLMRQLANNPSAVQGINDQILAQKVLNTVMEKVKVTWTEPSVKPMAEADAKAPVPTAVTGDAPEDFEPQAE